MDAWVWCRGRGHQALCMQGQYSRGTMSRMGAWLLRQGTARGPQRGRNFPVQ